jgi:hypothetical protein
MATLKEFEAALREYGMASAWRCWKHCASGIGPSA